ncbi:hypothetical protein NDU88_002026 [Pleurodeles waltl]|uniref:Uncharacterized protein n=1 Tax=Pleurodeles waltl TaxID=8319 RepID=A0AAV7T1Q7_PLEWA|nr:hypothetical protein NDU88_002026 [Pleurodeles waltl]
MAHHGGVVDVGASCPRGYRKGKEIVGAGVVDVRASCPRGYRKGKEIVGAAFDIGNRIRLFNAFRKANHLDVISSGAALRVFCPVFQCMDVICKCFQGVLHVP